MTLVYTENEALQAGAAPGGPRTHVLAVGVGNYPYLVEDGAQPRAEGIPPLGQLTSPTASARAFARWFTTGEMRNPAAPLGSVELLVSDANNATFTPRDGAPPAAVEPATFLNVAWAFKRWFDRCDAHESNVAVFYFCGHGLQKVNVLLLPEDFGSLPNPWISAIDFDRTFRGMSHCQARTQLYLIDACREVSRGLVDEETVGGQPLARAYPAEQKTLRSAPKLFAAAEQQRAFGQQGEVSRFTAAVLAALRGGAAKRKAGTTEWAVSTTSLGEAVRKIVEAENEKLPRDEWLTVDPQSEGVGSAVLHALPPGTPPAVRAMIGCLPEEALPLARLVLRGRAGEFRREPTDGPWVAEIPAGVYDVLAQFDEPRQFDDMPLADEIVEPPVYKPALRVTPHAPAGARHG